MTAIVVLVYVVLVYLFIGTVVGVLALIVFPARIEARVREAPRRVRLILLPGAAALWPAVAAKLVRGAE